MLHIIPVLRQKLQAKDKECALAHSRAERGRLADIIHNARVRILPGGLYRIGCNLLFYKKHSLMQSQSKVNGIWSASCYTVTIFYCSICLPKNAAAVLASLISISPNFVFASLVKKITEPMASPSLIIGVIT